MNAPFSLRMTKAEFVRWVERQEGKYEWKEGRVVQMTNVTKAHARIVSNFIGELRNRLDLDMWSVTASDLGVEDDDFLRYPDVIVEPMDNDIHGRRAKAPVLMVEVLSASSVDVDFLEKTEEYTRFATLQMYIIASQDEAICWIYERDAATGGFPNKPIKISGLDQNLEIKALGKSLPVSALYRGVVQ